MKTISFATMKGGTGKTTLSFNIACCLAQNKKVLVMDCDPQCNISANLRFDIFNEEAITVADLFENPNIDPLDILVASPLENLKNLDLFPSTMYLLGTELRLSTKPMREMVLSNYIKANAQVFGYYDYIIFDTAPNMGIVNQNAFFASDSIILCVDPDCNSAKGAQVFLKLWDEAVTYADKTDNTCGLIINNVERTKITKSLKEYIDSEPRLSAMQFKNTIPHTTRFKECAEQNVPIFDLETKTKKDELSKKRAVDALNNLVSEMEERRVL